MHEVGGPAALGAARGIGGRKVAPVIAHLGGVAAAGDLRPYPTPIHIDGPRAMLQEVGGHRALQGLAGHEDRLPSGLERGAPSLPCGGLSRTLSRCPIDRLGCVKRLGEARAIDPTAAIADLPPRILNGNGHAVEGAGASKGQEVGSGLGHPQGLRPKGHTGHAPIPLLAHEAAPAGGILQGGGGAAGQPVGWIGHNGIH